MSGYEIHLIRRGGQDESRVLHTGGDSYPQVRARQQLGTAEDLGRIFDGAEVVPALVSHLASVSPGIRRLEIDGRTPTIDELRRVWQEEYDEVSREREHHSCYVDLDAFLQIAERLSDSVFGLQPHQISVITAAASFCGRERSFQDLEQNPARHFNVRYFASLVEKLTDHLNDGCQRHPALTEREADTLRRAADYFEYTANRYRPFEQPKWERPHKDYKLVEPESGIAPDSLLHWAEEVQTNVLNEWPTGSSALVCSARRVLEALRTLREKYPPPAGQAQEAQRDLETALIAYADWLTSTIVEYDTARDCRLEDAEHEAIEEMKEAIGARLSDLLSKN